MTPDQEKMIRGIATGVYPPNLNDPLAHRYDEMPELQALALAVLELHSIGRASLLEQLIDDIDDSGMDFSGPNCRREAAALADSLLDILDCEPPMAAGHVVENRQGAALAYRTIIQAIRRGE